MSLDETLSAGLPTLERITLDPEVMGGKPCIRGMRVTVGTLLGLLAAGHSEARILEAYPYLEAADINREPSAMRFLEEGRAGEVSGVEIAGRRVTARCQGGEGGVLKQNFPPWLGNETDLSPSGRKGDQ